MRQPIKTIISAAVASVIANQASYAGAFSLYTESSAAKIGNYAAGSAAEASDASTGWYNPAGLALIKQQEILLSGIGIFPSSKLTGMSTFSTTSIPPYIQSFSNLQGAKKALVPAAHYAKPLGNSATFGLSMVSPFGLSTDWGQASPVRYSATLTELQTVNISPEIGGKVTDNFLLGGGLDFQWAQVKFNQILGAPALGQQLQVLGVPGQSPTRLDSLSYNKGHSFGLGFHAGVLGMFNENHTRLGLNYQSEVRHQFNGYSTLTGRLADAPELLNPNLTFKSNGLFSNTVALPDMTTLSVYQDINDKLAVLGSVVYAGWSSFKTIQLNQVAAIAPDLESQALVDSTAIEDYKDAWRFALGANYQFTDIFMLRIGGGYDQTPTIDAQRDIRLPDANRWAASIGGHIQARPNLGLDLGYTYLWANKNTRINKNVLLGEALEETSSNLITARANNHVHLIGLQAVWMVDQPNTTKK